MLAIGIQVAAILAIIGVFPVLARADKEAWLTSVALYRAQEKMDQILLANSLISSTPQTDNPTDLPSGYRQWVGQIDASNPAIQTVTVTVTWVEGGIVHSLALTSAVDP